MESLHLDTYLCGRSTILIAGANPSSGFSSERNELFEGVNIQMYHRDLI